MKKLFLFLALSIFITEGAFTQSGNASIYLGADLSYLNEMIDCGGEFRSNGKIVEPYQFFASQGANIVRVRLWNNPEWTKYSNYDDVKRTIESARKNNMKILLDFHYSDTWADPQKQLIPKAWKEIEDYKILGDSVYFYTFNILTDLNKLGLLPEFVQVGNETNSEILLKVEAAEHGKKIDWNRNSFLLNRGLQAVHDVSAKTGVKIESMIHIAQPENALWWFKEAKENNLIDFDWIGLSYYPKWSTYGLDKLEIALDSLKKTYQKRIMIVETAYPYNFENVDSAGNILGKEALVPDFPGTPEGQYEYMVKLTKVTLKGGGEGVIYWEPAWISTKCSTLWGLGSHWENATFFDSKNGNEALEAFKFYNYPY